MPRAQAHSRVVVVTGDVSMDWHLAHPGRLTEGISSWSPDRWTRACWQRGGAALLADVIEAVADRLRQEGKGELSVRQTGAPREPILPRDQQYHHSYALWSPFGRGKGTAWRVEQYLGLDRGQQAELPATADWQGVVDDTPEAELLILDDANLGFRHRPELWPLSAAAGDSRPWVLVKMSQPVADGALWDHLRENLADRLIVLMTIDDLRLSEVQISQGLSWERTAQDIAWELVHNPRVNGFARCACVVVSFGPAGAVAISRLDEDGNLAPEPAPPRCLLFFDPTLIEGVWEHDHPGGMIGYGTCLTAGVARQLMLSPDKPHLPGGIQSGLAAMRALHLEGYNADDTAASQVRLAFPIQKIAGELSKDSTLYAVADVQDPVRFLTQLSADDDKAPEGGYWTILEERYRDNMDLVARQIVLEGPEAALRDVPLGKFGHLLTVDRREIESFRSIGALASEYLSQAKQKRPLSIAVFGPPGSGKSFGIIQVANSLAPGQIEVLEFNISQFESPDELGDALHQVRDVNLSGKIPLVFWDEFDTPLEAKPLGWLRYFLSPMQDGSFREGQLVHPIGRCIFVFAGGTSHRMESFGRDLSPEEFRGAKVPDFVSRLKGYVNILGPNRQMGGADPHFAIRRAIILRSILQRNASQLFHKQDGKQLLDIDHGVLRALIETREYKHGIRSMESIIAMSLLSGKRSFERSSLPSEAQLDLHVDGQEFLALVQRIDLESKLLERLAEANHEVFCEGLGDEERKTHTSLKPYAELPEEEKEQNRGAVRDIVNKLAAIGYLMIPARSNEPPFQFPGPHLDELAQMEHERWMQAKLEGGWRYAAETRKQDRLHSALLAWEDLSEAEREKDRNLIRAIPRILAKAGYTVVELRGKEA
jgi:hypothetical protein